MINYKKSERSSSTNRKVLENKRIQPLKVSPLSDYKILENKFPSTQIKKPLSINIKPLPKITIMSSSKADFNSREFIKEPIKSASNDVSVLISLIILIF
jgi:hypothetical protein